MPQATSQIITPTTRARIEKAIERLIGVLDAIDPDPDLEPSLSGNGGYGIPTGHDLEHDGSELEVSYTETHGRGGQTGSSPYDDAEPSLGWTEAVRADGVNAFYPQQCGSTDDREHEDEREPEDFV